MLLELAFSVGPVHLTGKAFAKAHVRTGFVSGPMMLTVTLPRWSHYFVWKSHFSNTGS